MNTERLLTQLVEIEQAMDILEPAELRSMLCEAQETVLELEKQMIDVLLDYESLQLLMDFSRRPALSDLPEREVPGKYSVN